MPDDTLTPPTHQERLKRGSPPGGLSGILQSTATEGEFKVTVRKLEMPVRPRGVLAE